MADEEILEQLQAIDTAPQKPINETRRLLMLVVSTASAICVSFSYAFNLISEGLQKRYNLTQNDLTLIVSVGLACQYFLLPWAVVYDYCGPISTGILAVTFFSCGSILMALSFQGIIQGTVLRLSVFYALMGAGSALYALNGDVTTLTHFPTSKGYIVGLIKSFIGLGSAIVACINLAFFTSHVEWYFYFLTSFAVMTGILCLIFMRLPAFHLTGYEISHLTDEQKAERTRRKAQYLRQRPPMRPFYFGFVIIILLIIYLPLQSTLMTYLELSNNCAVAFAIITIALCLFYCLIAVPLPFLRRTKASSPSADSDDVTDIDVNGTAVVKCIQADATHNAQSDGRATADAVPETEVDYIAPQYETTFIQSLCRPEIWLMWWTVLSFSASELVLIFNASYILGALSGKMPDKELNSLLTVLNGAGSAMGRLIVAYYEIKSQRGSPEERTSITVPVYFPGLTTIVAYVLFLTLPANLLPIPYVFIALSNGFMAASIVLVTRTLFAKDPAKFYTFVLTCGVVATIVFNRLIYGEWYTYQAKRIGDGKVCLKKKCVLLPLIVVLGVSLTAFLTTTWLHIRYCRFCRRVLEERAHIREQITLERKGENSHSNNDN